MTTPTQYFSWFPILFVCVIALLVSCSDNAGPDRSTMEISRISPDSGAIGTRISIYSNSIDPEHSKNRIEINGIPVPILSFGSNKLVVEVPEGMSSGPVTLQVNGKVANGPYFKVLTEGPEIDGVTPGRGGPGTRVTITGDHFLPASMMAKISGDSTARDTIPAPDDSLQADVPDLTLKAKGEPTPNINGLPVSVAFGDQLAPLLSLSSTKIIAEVPEKTTGGTITLTVGKQTVTSSSFTFIRPPVISKVSRTTGPVGSEVTISGHYFSPQADSNQVSFNGARAEITEADSTRLVVTVPDDATTGLIKITAYGQTVTGPTFTISETPVSQVQITSIDPKSGPVGTKVTITGQNFASDKAANTVTFNGTNATITSATKTKLVATVPKGATNGPVKVTASGQTAAGPSFTVTPDPDKQLAITGLSPKEGPVGTNVTISGANFSATKAENTVTFNGTEATVSSASTTELVVTVPQGATTGSVKVQVGNQTAEGPTFTVTKAPLPQVSISDISPKQGTAGTEVTISGENFSANKTENTVTFNGTEATVHSASKTKLVVAVPDKATDGPVKVQVGDQTASGPSFDVTEAPVPEVTIEDISPKQGPVGTQVTITGQNFSSTNAENTVYFNGTEAAVSSATETTLEVTVPQGATNGPVKVTANGQTASGPTFTVTAAPVPHVSISDISPKQGTVGTEVTINGQNFSGQKAENTVTFNGTKATVQTATTTKLVVAVPNGATTGSVKVQVGNQTAEGPTFTVTETPVPQVAIDDISPKEGPVGTEVTISGTNFSATAAENTVTFNGTEATVSSASPTELVVSVPADATSGPVQVTVGSQTATGPNFNITENQAPTITSDASFEVDENSMAVGTITATDPEGDALTYSLSGGADANKFTINANSGKLAFTDAPDFENPGDSDGDNVYEVTVEASDGSLTNQQAVTVTVENKTGAISFNKGRILLDSGPIYNADPPDFVFDPVPEGTDLANVRRDISIFAEAVERNLDGSGSNLAVQVSGPDASFFNVGVGSIIYVGPSTNGPQDIDFDLEFTGAPPDYENPADAGGDNTYQFTVTITDTRNGDSYSQEFTIPISDVQDNQPPVFTSPASFDVDENTTDVGTVTATDPEGDALTYSISGDDARVFSIDSNSGTLAFITAPDYENPVDTGVDNVYDVEVHVSDGPLSDTQNLHVTVQNVIEAPEFGRSRILSVGDIYYYAYEPNFVYEAVPEGTDLSNVHKFNILMSGYADPVTNVTLGGPDGAGFSVKSINQDGHLIILSGPTLEYSHSAGDTPHQYQFTITAENAAGQTATQTFTIPVAPSN